MTQTILEPRSSTDPSALLLDYLDFFRGVVDTKVRGLSQTDLHTAQVPSDWTPAQLVVHLTFMERRWLVWGFLAEAVDDPWGDERDGRWYADPEATADDLLAALHRGGERTRQIASAANLEDRAAVGGRFPTSQDTPTLLWTLHHVLQEFTRHTGHLDISRELADGAVGET